MKALSLKRKQALNEALKKPSLELLVEVDPGKKFEVAKDLARAGKVGHVYELIPYLSFSCERAELKSILSQSSVGYRELAKNLRGLEASSKFKISPIISKSAVEMWNLENIGAYDAWNYSDGTGSRVGVIDTGIEYTHDELAYNFQEGFDFVEKTADPMDKNGHGTHVSGIIAGKSCGAAPGTSLYAARVLDGDGEGFEGDVIAGLEWCIKKNLDVVNMSLGSPVGSSAFEKMCDYGARNGMLMVAAAGNDGNQNYNYPASFDSVISVAAVDEWNRHAEFSNTNDKIAFSAPGVGIKSSYIGGSYAVLDGTSMASPHVAGALSIGIPILGDDVLAKMQKTAKNLGEAQLYGCGIIQAGKMVCELGFLSFIRELAG